MDKTQVQLFLHRWQAVEEVRQREARAATIELRWRQLNAAYNIMRKLNLVSDRPNEELGHERWARLKEKAARVNKA